MAKLLPAEISSEVSSSGEKMIFRLFESEPGTNNWVVIHSLLLSKHVRNFMGEIDFLILAPGLGIFVIEVKSGRVKREKGVWKYINRFGKATVDRRGPYQQARDAMFSLKRYFTEKYGTGSRMDELLINYGVIFPHIKDVPVGPEIEKWQILSDLTSGDQGKIRDFVKRLSFNSIRKYSKASWFDDKRSIPDESVIRELSNFLRPDFTGELPESSRMRMNENQILELTEQQYKVLDVMGENSRCLFKGAAGTGKTFLAVEYAHRCIERGENIAIICVSEQLGKWLADQFKDNSNDGFFAGSIRKLVSNSKMTGSLDSPDPEEELLKLIDTDIFQYDRIIVDEAQDIFSNEIFPEIIDMFLKGGWENGKWYLFGDFESQAISSSRSSESLLRLLNTKSSNYSTARLDTNCRNTQRIGTYLTALSGFSEPPFKYSEIKGEPPILEFFTDVPDLIKRIRKSLKSMLKGGISSSDITCLSNEDLKSSVFRELMGEFSIEDMNSGSHKFFDRKNVTHSSISKFKGLENKQIIVTEIGTPDEEFSRKLIYTGLSRARHRLVIFIPESQKEVFNQYLIKNVTGAK